MSATVSRLCGRLGVPKGASLHVLRPGGRLVEKHNVHGRIGSEFPPSAILSAVSLFGGLHLPCCPHQIQRLGCAARFNIPRIRDGTAANR
jgi:hypothetical protein